MSLDWNDDLDVIKVKRWFKRHKIRNTVTNVVEEYKIYLDYDFYRVNDGAFYILGSPLQLYTDAILGDATKDTRILVEEEELPLSQLENDPPTYQWNGELFYKFPNT